MAGFLKGQIGWLSQGSNWLAFSRVKLAGFLKGQIGWLSQGSNWLAFSRDSNHTGFSESQPPRIDLKAVPAHLI